MKFDSLVAITPQNGLFRTGQILSGEATRAHITRQLDRWVKAGRILQLRRGVYAVAEPFRKEPLHQFAAANALRKASYVSLQSALAHYGMIPEYVPVITSITTGRPEQLATPIGRFHFRHLGVRRFFGYEQIEVARDQHALLATPEKALADLLYLTPHCDHINYLRELRLERPDSFDTDALMATVESMASLKLKRAVNILTRLWYEQMDLT